MLNMIKYFMISYKKIVHNILSDCRNELPVWELYLVDIRVYIAGLCNN